MVLVISRAMGLVTDLGIIESKTASLAPRVLPKRYTLKIAERVATKIPMVMLKALALITLRLRYKGKARAMVAGPSIKLIKSAPILYCW